MVHCILLLCRYTITSLQAAFYQYCGWTPKGTVPYWWRWCVCLWGWRLLLCWVTRPSPNGHRTATAVTVPHKRPMLFTSTWYSTSPATQQVYNGSCPMSMLGREDHLLDGIYCMYKLAWWCTKCERCLVIAQIQWCLYTLRHWCYGRMRWKHCGIELRQTIVVEWL